MEQKFKTILVWLAVFLAVIVVLAPVAEQAVKTWIRSELRGYIRAGRLEIEDISISPKRREFRILGLQLKDESGASVVSIPKIDILIRRIHHGHVDATLKLFDPAVTFDLDRPAALLRLFRPEAFEDDGFLEIARIDAQNGRMSISATGVLAAPDTLIFSAAAQLEGESRTLDVTGRSGRTAVEIALRVQDMAGNIRLLDGTVFKMVSSNIALLPKTSDTPEVHLLLTPADTSAPSFREIGWHTTLDLGPLHGRFDRLRNSGKSAGLFRADRVYLALGPERLVMGPTDFDVREDSFQLRSENWRRAVTGLNLENVRLSASPGASSVRLKIDGHEAAASVAWENGPAGRRRVRLAFASDSLPVADVLREIGETFPISGLAWVRIRAGQEDTPPHELAWSAEIRSPDLRVGPGFGKLSIGADLTVAGRGTTVQDLDGQIEPAKAVPIRVTGRPRASGFYGRLHLKDRPLRDIQILAESFGRDVPLVGETGTVRLDVDFFINRNLQFSSSGRLILRNATAQARGFPFRIEGVDVDIPVRYSPDTGKLVVSEAANGTAFARSLLLGPYRFEDLAVKTSSKGDKLYADFSPVRAFGGEIQAKMLFHFSAPTQQQLDLSVSGLSLGRILEPYPDGRGAISGLIGGEVRVTTRGGDIQNARGTVRMDASEGPGEPMRVSRRFLQEVGGKAVRQLKLPDRVGYRNGHLKVRLSDGRILFDEVSLDAGTLIRRVRIGQVIGSYKIATLIDVLSTVSPEDMKIDLNTKFLGRRKKK
ncbi:hypothetical protein HY522_09180 [bacterium]|nr:hypothetical protein [bacterium]